MIRIDESIGEVGSTYTRTSEDGTTDIIRTTCSRQMVNGIDTFVFRNYQMDILMEPSCFLTDELRWESRNTAVQAVSALKALTNYCEIINTPFEAFDISQARSFLMFLRGTLGEGIEYAFRLSTQRSEGTISAYLKHIRRYARWRGVGNSPFLQPKRSVIGGSAVFVKEPNGTHRLKADIREDKEAPRYISLDEYHRIMGVIEQDWTTTEKSIVRLMFEHGLRIGEVLGLTTEDLEWSETPDGTPRYAVILRNRATDRFDQHAKTLMKISDGKEYQSADYRKRNYGYQRVFISEDLFFLLAEHAETTLSEDNTENFADSVKGDDGNQYLFTNTLGRPLSSNLWNKRLRKIMIDAGVSVDKEARKTNLNHRFRHGYAMFLTRSATKNGRHFDEFEVMTLMRHRSLSSTQIYHRPTSEDIRELQEEVIGALADELYGEGE